MRRIVAHSVALALAHQPQMGNSRPGRRLGEVRSQARMASIGSERQARERTPKSAARIQVLPRPPIPPTLLVVPR